MKSINSYIFKKEAIKIYIAWIATSNFLQINKP